MSSPLPRRLGGGAPARRAGLCGPTGVLLFTFLVSLSPAFAAEEVPYVQTPQPVVDAMLKLAGVNGRDYLIDLGSGDGRIGTRGFGVDYVGTLVQLANDNAAKAGVADRVRFEERDIFKTDLSAATVVAFYLLPDFNLELRPKLLEELRPGTRLVSHDGDMGDWPPDAKIVVDAPGKTVGVEKKSTIYLWVVPAMVMGEWTTRIPLGNGTKAVTLDLAQSFQSLSGAATVREASIVLERAYVQGQFVFFRFPYDGGTVRFQGRATKDRIVGRVTTPDGRTHPWRALRAN